MPLAGSVAKETLTEPIIRRGGRWRFALQSVTYVIAKEGSNKTLESNKTPTELGKESLAL